MAFTPEQKAFRLSHIGGSDANIIMGGDDERILYLYKLKRGDAQDEDLSNVLPVQMGIFTEPFNVMWFEKQTGRKVTNQGDQFEHPKHKFMGCTLDGLTDDGKTVFEAKHVGGFSNAEEIQDRYMPQLYHNMNVTGAEKAVLSVFYGNHKWEMYEFHQDAIQSSIVEGAVTRFWECVQKGIPPVAEKSLVKVDAIRRVDMTGNNRWASLAQQYRDNLAQYKLYNDAVDGMKKMVEDDVAEVWGHGISFKRDKRGSLRMKGD